MVDKSKSKIGWNHFEPESCECINAKTGVISTSVGKKDVLILELELPNGEEIIKFFNAKKTSKGNYTVPRNSDFACLYRLATGDNPLNRFSRADQLSHHLVGLKYIVNYKESSSSDNKRFYKAGKVVPENPIITSEWTKLGKLKGRRRGRYSKRHKEDIDSTKRRQKPSIDEAINKHVKNSNIIPSGLISTPLKDTASRVDPLEHRNIVYPYRDKEITISFVDQLLRDCW